MKMGLIVAVAAMSLFAAPVFAASSASSTSEVEVQGGSLGTGTTSITASDVGSAKASEVFGTSDVTTSNTASDTESTKGFAAIQFTIIGEDTGSASSHF